MFSLSRDVSGPHRQVTVQIRIYKIVTFYFEKVLRDYYPVTESENSKLYHRPCEPLLPFSNEMNPTPKVNRRLCPPAKKSTMVYLNFIKSEKGYLHIT